MRITESRIKQIIREEARRVLREESGEGEEMGDVPEELQRAAGTHIIISPFHLLGVIEGTEAEEKLQGSPLMKAEALRLDPYIYGNEVYYIPKSVKDGDYVQGLKIPRTDLKGKRVLDARGEQI